MCGVHGFVGGQRNYAALKAMLAACDHRGPDGRGVWGDGRVQLAHNLLATRGPADLSRQPWQQGGGALCFNGEIYHTGLRDKDGTPARLTDSDVDTHELAALLSRYKAKVLGSVDGMYALAWYDDEASTVLLARDRNGAKPLYYAENAAGRSLVFSSELRGLFAAGVKRRLDPVGVRLYLQFGYVPGPRTLIDGVRKLVPGECRLYDLAESDKGWSAALASSWNVSRAPDPSEFDPQTYRDRLVESVRRCLVTGRPIGLYLSGGLDSCSVLWAMHELGARPQTLSMRFDNAGPRKPILDGDCDAASLMAASCGVDHREMLFGESDYLANLDDAFFCDEPIARTGMPAYLAAHRRAAELGWVVAFTGDGGDELLSGYGNHADVLAPGFAGTKDPLARWLRLQSHSGAEVGWRSNVARGFDVAAYMASWVPSALLTGDRLRDELSLECVTHLAEDFLMRSDKLGMSQGLECRFPLLQEPFRGYALGLPSAVKMYDGRPKWCARQAMRGVLPDLVIDKPKSGWGPPTGSWLSGKSNLTGPYGNRIRKTLRKGRLPALDRIIDVAACDGRIKIALSLFYLILWAERTGLEG
jgi:asparagine synthase (glutamine-hydrolysing)